MIYFDETTWAIIVAFAIITTIILMYIYSKDD